MLAQGHLVIQLSAVEQDLSPDYLPPPHPAARNAL